VALITPFNFPLEIPALQLMGALYMGNKPLLHCDHRVMLATHLAMRQTQLSCISTINGRHSVTAVGLHVEAAGHVCQHLYA
jgi:acyl-CoA reductase-like NAD-dependent aldehyde dehydrogenase